MNAYLPYLSVDLPEDIAKLKGCGQFNRAIRAIDKRLKRDLPEALRRRLELEKEILALIPANYTHSFDETLALMSQTFKDFDASEMEELWELDAADWYFIDGELRFRADIAANLAKVRPAYAARLKNPEELKDREGNIALLDETIAKMKEKGSLAYRIRIRSTLTIASEAVRPGETVKVHLPIPIEYAQVKNFRLISVLPEPKLVAAPDYPQRTVFFEEPTREGQTFSVEYEYINSMTYVDPKPELVAPSQPAFHTEEQHPHIVFSPYIRYLTEELTGGEKNPLIRARRIYDFITTNVMYSLVRPYFTIENISAYALTSLKGDCGVQALAFITLCRCAGIPARWQAGLYSKPGSAGNHDWAQFYIAPYGWLFADCSFGGSAWRWNATERWNFYFGNLDPFRMPSNSEYQFEFNPGKSFLRIDPYDNQVGEAEYEDRGLKSGEFNTVHEMVDITEVDA